MILRFVSFLLQVLQAMNKTKRFQPLKNTIKREVRPKRCNLCRKVFPVSAYKAHFEKCYRFDSGKNQTSNFKDPPKIENSLVQIDKTKGDKMSNPANVTNKFRIKHVSNHYEPNPRNNVSPNILQQSVTNKVSQNDKFADQPQINGLKHEMPHQRFNKKQQQQLSYSNVIDLGWTSNHRQYRQCDKTETEIDQNFQLQRSTQLLQEIQQSQQSEPQPQINRRPQSQQNITENNSEVLNSQIIQIRNQTNEQDSSDVATFIQNTNSIIHFIRSLPVLNDDETLNLMIAQLQQLIRIAVQIQQLNRIGRSLAIGNVFALRIHQVQSAIMHQIGIALTHRFGPNLPVQFQILAQRQPQLKVGFTEQEMEKMFSQKINCFDKQCSICLQDMKKYEVVLQLQCLHIFHLECIKEWLKGSKKCPLCRKEQICT